ncbi:aminoglycoside phosphotransferase family protein [Shimia aestuarii]|uniref:aminoglycoside phosphotransferase family protein n=1 Tax=Shimia aestuarii TaxID=254406 RepID=UPI001FB3E86D|nr:phosphotransferase [Shimia aestuarii]
MTDRASLLDKFLNATPWSDAERAPLAGDASNRRYLRLVHDHKTAVLMDAPPESGEDIRPFVAIAQELRDAGLSAPQVLFQDRENGFLLLEDLGDDLFARVVKRAPELETLLYESATDVLLSLHAHPIRTDLAAYSPAVMTEMAALSYRWYLRGHDRPFEEAALKFEAAFRPLLETHASGADVLIQRDYHAENLLWLPERDGVQRVGLLDFQDAMKGHRAYDLVSLLQDARRDVSPALEQEMLDRYISVSRQPDDAFRAAYHALGVQRNLRIIGVFARLSMHFGKPHYVDFIPRVWGYLLRDLAHPALAPVRNLVLDSLPVPTKPNLQTLKDKCGTFPTL